LGDIWFPNRLWCCELISIVGLLWRPFWFQNGRQTMATAAILNFFNPPKICHILRWIFLQSGS
jgi:hypothetical protein